MSTCGRVPEHVNNAKGDRTVTAIKQSKKKKVVQGTKRVTGRPAVWLQGAETFFFSRRFDSNPRRTDAANRERTRTPHPSITRRNWFVEIKCLESTWGKILVGEWNAGSWFDCLRQGLPNVEWRCDWTPEEKWRAIKPRIGTPTYTEQSKLAGMKLPGLIRVLAARKQKTKGQSRTRSNPRTRTEAGQGGASLPAKEGPDPGPEGSPLPGGEVEREPVGEVVGIAGRYFGREDAARNWGKAKWGDETRREDMGGEARVGTGAGRDYCNAPTGWGRITPGPGGFVAGEEPSG